jgi:hypothetical protein
MVVNTKMGKEYCSGKYLGARTGTVFRFFVFKTLKVKGVPFTKNASQTERAWSFYAVKRSEVERQETISSLGKLISVF